MKRVLPSLLLSVALLRGAPVLAAPAGHCAPATITPVAGDPGAYRIETPHGVTIARRYPSPAAPAATADIAVIRVFPATFDADGDTLGTEHDTILVAAGTTVRWVRAGPGFHTVTNGADSGDLNAASEYNAIFDDLTTSFERVFTTLGINNFFCFIHEPRMMGSIIVTSATTDAPHPGVIRKPTFTRAPAPNPTRGGVSFGVAVPRATHVLLTVHDVSGRTVATLRDDALPAGEHFVSWDGRARDGRLAAAGRYFIRLAAGEVSESRAVSLVR
jgi:plastocyanin